MKRAQEPGVASPTPAKPQRLLPSGPQARADANPIASSSMSLMPPPSDDIPTLEGVNHDIQLHILCAFDSAQALLAYISASPIAARLFWAFKKIILAKFVGNTLSLQAVQTGVRIHHFKKLRYSTTLRVVELAKAGAAVTEDYLQLDTEVLETLFRLCLSHEPSVDDCMQRRWLTGKIYSKKISAMLKRAYPFFYQSLAEDMRYDLTHLGRPSKGGVPLSARLYSGFFTLELFMCGRKIAYSWDGNRWDDLARLFALPQPQRQGSYKVWAGKDLMADMSIVSMYMHEIVYTDVTARARGGESGWAIAARERVTNLFLRSTSHMPHTLKYLVARSSYGYDYESCLMDALNVTWSFALNPYPPFEEDDAVEDPIANQGGEDEDEGLQVQDREDPAEHGDDEEVQGNEIQIDTSVSLFKVMTLEMI